MRIDITDALFLFRAVDAEYACDFTGKTTLTFDLWIDEGCEDIFTSAADCGINFTSDGSWDQGGFSVPAATLKALRLNPGWNEVVIPLPDPEGDGVTADTTKITSMRLYAVNSKPGKTIRFDNFRLSAGSGPEEPEEPEDPNVLMWNDCDVFTSVFGTGQEVYFGPDTEEMTQGFGSIKWVINDGNLFMIYWKEGHSVDASEYNCFEFDIWVPKADFFDYTRDSRIQIGSGNTNDTQEMTWQMSAIEWKEGWNHIQLPFSTATYSVDWEGNQDIDLTNMNYFRLFGSEAEAYRGEELTWRLDNMRFTKNGGNVAEKDAVIEDGTGLGITVEAAEGVLPKGSTLTIRETNVFELNDEQYYNVESMTYKNILVLDTALANGEEILVPGGSLKYTVPLPVNFGSGKLSLYMVAEDGTMKLLNFTAADGALTFETNQTGIFVVMEDAAQGTPPGSGETSDPDKEPGDADSSAPDTGVAPLGLAALVPPALAAAAMAASRRRRRGNGAE